MNILPMREPRVAGKCRDIRAVHKRMILFDFVTNDRLSRPSPTLLRHRFALLSYFFLIYSCFAERL